MSCSMAASLLPQRLLGTPALSLAEATLALLLLVGAWRWETRIISTLGRARDNRPD